MSRPGGIALVGCGHWGKNIARNLHQLGRLDWVVDANPAVLAGVRESYRGVRTASGLERLLKNPRLAAVVLASPAALHYQMAKAALLAGKDVFVEKPLALRVAEAEELGELHYLYSNRANLGKVRQEENILWSFAPHDIDVILLLMNALPEWASTSGESYLQHEIADVTMTCLGFPGKARAHVFVSWLHPLKEQKLVVIGSRKMAIFDDVVKEGKLKLFDKGVDMRDGRPVIRQTSESTLFFPETEPLREELLHFLDCVRSRRAPRTDGRNGLRVLRVLDACQRSLASGGQPVRL